MSQRRLPLASRFDRLGATASFLCAVHCAALPLVIATLPAIGLGFLANHEPVLSVLRPGVVRVHGAAGDTSVEIQGGFVSFDHNVITIVAEPVELDTPSAE